MIPITSIDLAAGLEVNKEPSLTYALNLNQFALTGTIDDVAAVRQAILKILNTERFAHSIYSWNYGVQFHDLLGMDYPYVMSEVKKRITDALLADDRIASVDNFQIEQVKKDVLNIAFIVTTMTGGIIDYKQEVMLGV